MADDTLVTIVVVPRERYSLVDRCLASIVAATALPHHLVCVAGGAPPYVEALLRRTCAEHDYELIVRPEHLSPNAARNLGLAQVTTRYVAFLDNDVVVAPGWLEALVACAEETNGDVVGPLCLIGEPRDGIAHSGGGCLELVARDGTPEVVARHLWQNVDLTTRPLPHARERRDFIEGHALLVRRDVFDHIGGWDEELLSLFDYIDLGLEVRRIGGAVWFEPSALICYLAFEEFTVGDLDYFVGRWSDDWNDRSVARLAAKWSISPDTHVFTDGVDFARSHQPVCKLPRATSRRTTTIDDDHGFAQTNVQLLNQMHLAGYPADDLEAVRVAYDAASLLFASRFRPSGKTLLAHLVGTASVLAAYGAHAPLVAAGLVHASYTRGGFPDGSGSDYDAHRRWLRSRVGALTEAIVHEYCSLDRAWIAHVVDTDIDRLPLNVAYAIVLRIANLVEERLDQQFAYYGTAELNHQTVAEQISQWEAVYDNVATRLGFRTMLSNALDLVDRAEETDVDPALRSPRTRDFVIDPASGTRESIRPTAISTRPRSEPPAYDSTFAVPRRLALGPARLQLDLDAFSALNGGDITRGRDTLLVSCDSRQWAYSASCELGDPPIRGRGILRVKVAIEAGELAVAVLVRGSPTAFAAPEHLQGPTDEAIELLFPVDAVEECGAIVLRSSAPDGVVTRARLEDVAVHAPASDCFPPLDHGLRGRFLSRVLRRLPRRSGSHARHVGADGAQSAPPPMLDHRREGLT